MHFLLFVIILRHFHRMTCVCCYTVIMCVIFRKDEGTAWTALNPNLATANWRFPVFVIGLDPLMFCKLNRDALWTSKRVLAFKIFFLGFMTIVRAGFAKDLIRLRRILFQVHQIMSFFCFENCNWYTPFRENCHSVFTELWFTQTPFDIHYVNIGQQ